uniref:Uncharacterized protein n=1 Tax=viral metagenome TaxID=1070528 RepID=A0A6C0KUG6_9ZZZZ
MERWKVFLKNGSFFIPKSDSTFRKWTKKMSKFEKAMDFLDFLFEKTPSDHNAHNYFFL